MIYTKEYIFDGLPKFLIDIHEHIVNIVFDENECDEFVLKQIMLFLRPILNQFINIPITTHTIDEIASLVRSSLSFQKQKGNLIFLNKKWKYGYASL